MSWSLYFYAKFTVRKECVRKRVLITNWQTTKNRRRNPWPLLANVAFHENTRIKWRDLTRVAGEECGVDLHQCSLQRLFSQMNGQKLRCLHRPLPLSEHAAKRLTRANIYWRWTSWRWRKVRWSDECSVVREEGVRDMWTTCSRRYTKDVWATLEQMFAQN